MPADEPGEDAPPKRIDTEGVKTFLKKRRAAIQDWWYGTDENPVPVFSWRARITRWWRVAFCGYVYMITTMYDRPNDEYILRRDIIHRSKLMKEAVPVTNMKHTYHVDLDLEKRGFSTVPDNGFTAVSAFLYMKCNKMDEAMKVSMDDQSGIDTKKLLIILGVGAGIVLAVFMLSGAS